MPRTKRKSVAPAQAAAPTPEVKPHKPAQAKPEAKLTWLLEPKEQQWAMSSVRLWEDETHTYRIFRVDTETKGHAEFATMVKVAEGGKNGDGRWDTFEFNHKMGPGYPRFFRTLADAIESVETHTRMVSTNKEELISHAHKAGLDGASIVKVVSTPVVREPGVARARSGKMNIKDAAERVLSEEGKPMTPREMIPLMAERGYWSSNAGTPHATLGAALYLEVRDLKDKSRFTQVGKGVFALKGQG